MKNTVKTFEIKIKEYEKEQEPALLVQTKDINFTIEQIGRNRNIEKLDVREIKRPSAIDENDIGGPNARLGV